MFDFLFKRSARKPRPEESPARAPDTEPQAELVPAKDAAMAHAESLAGNEDAAIDFVLKSSYADARYKAAHHIHSKPALEQVAKAMRNTDRRVTRLVQKRLEEIELHEKAEQQANACLAKAQQLIAEPTLMPSQVADLDRAWAEAGNVPSPLRESFEQARATLRERLEAQAALQRAVMDVGAKLQKLTRAALEAPHVFTREKLLQSLESLEQEMAGYCTDREAPSLPQHLLTEFAKQLERFHETLAAADARNHAIAAREAALSNWEATPVSELRADMLQRAWQALPVVSEEGAALEERFKALLVRVSGTPKPKHRKAAEPEQSQVARFDEALANLEKALENGALQEASDQDKLLRSIDLATLKLSDAQNRKLTKARGELHRLQGWARWGGNVSREELLKAAEELPEKRLEIPELAKKVGSLRERWKSLDASAGSANRELWERFDAACTKAYEPVAMHFKKLADERQGNLEKAQAIVAEVRQFAAESKCADEEPEKVDWRAVAAFVSRAVQSWKQLGPIDRKEKKNIDADFADAMRMLSEPLAAQRKKEAARREELIAQASVLDPMDRRAADTLRTLQERWQERAKSLPLERKVEQALWLRFRKACDAVFAKRKEAAQAADADRQSNLREKQALCEMLEKFEVKSGETASKTMREAAATWGKIGPVPRAAEQQIEKRYQSALTALQKYVEDAQRSAHQAQVALLEKKLELCRVIEEMVVGNRTAEENVTQCQNEWKALPVLPGNWEQALRVKFDNAIDALKSEDRQYADLLQQNRDQLEQDVLRLEIIAGVESPPELSRERLQLQVEVLQSSLKTGQKHLAQREHLLRIAELPALMDEPLKRRIVRLAAQADTLKV